MAEDCFRKERVTIGLSGVGNQASLDHDAGRPMSSQAALSVFNKARIADREAPHVVK
jgi:hypothetical protein